MTHLVTPLSVGDSWWGETSEGVSKGQVSVCAKVCEYTYNKAPFLTQKTGPGRCATEAKEQMEKGNHPCSAHLTGGIWGSNGKHGNALMGKEHEKRSKTAGILRLILPLATMLQLATILILNKYSNFFISVFYYKIRVIVVLTSKLLWRWNDLIHVKCLGQCSAHSKASITVSYHYE